MIISRTPFRISFFGGGTDYPAWYLKHGGSVLATAINKYCYITCRYLPPFFEHKTRIVYRKIETCQTVEEISHPTVREALRFLNIHRGVEIHHDGDLPARSGMGSSSSFTVGLLNALYALKGQMPSKHQLAMESIHIEQNLLKETVGSQDQVLAAYGGFNIISFLSNGEISVRPITISAGRMEELNDHLLLFYTGIIRTASDVAKTYIHDIENKKRQLRLLNALLDESVSILRNGHDVKAFGELIHEAWMAKRSLGKNVSNPQVDEIYKEALAAGATGGKLTGAGGGGFLLLFAPPGAHDKIKARMNRLIQVPFKFDTAGSQIIFYDQQEDYTELEKDRKIKIIKPFEEMIIQKEESPG